MIELGLPGSPGWQAPVLREAMNFLADRPWSREMLVRGSLARGTADAQSDIDLVVTVAEDDFEAALRDLTGPFPKSLRGRLPAWVDSLVRDFGGIGFVYLLQIDEKKWGQLDVYLLPHGRRERVFSHGPVLSLRKRDDVKACDASTEARVDEARRRHERLAGQDPAQAALSCYVAAFLLRKRLIRRDPLQTYGDTYATADGVRNLVVLACCPRRSEQGWRGLEKCAEGSPDPGRVMKVLSTFAKHDLLEQPAELSGRVAALEEIVALLAPDAWRDHGDSLRSLGRYLCSNP